MAYIPHKQPTLAMYLELLNSGTYISVSEDSVEVGGNIPLPPGMARNTQVSLTAVEGEGFTGEATSFHTRLDVGALLENVSIDVTGPSTATSTHDCLAGINSRLGIELIEDDVEDLPIVNGLVTFKFTDQCYAYLGELVCTFIDETDPRDNLSEAITTTSLGGFTVLSSTDDSSIRLLVRLINSVNGTNFSDGDLSFGIPLPNAGAQNPGDTRVVVRATKKASYSGSMTVFYNRLNLSSVFPDGILTPIGEYDTIHEALDYINDRYPLWLWPFDVVDKDITVPGSTLDGTPSSLVLSPNTGPEVIPSDLWDYTPVLENMVEIQSTGYFRFIVLSATSLGPMAIGRPIDPAALGEWSISLNGTSFELAGPNEYEDTIVIPEAAGADHVDFTFDQNGGLMIVFTVAGIVYLRWYNPQAGQIQVDAIGPGATPYITPNTWNHILGTVEIFIVYYRAGDIRYRRQIDRYVEEFSLDVAGAADVLGVAVDPYNSLHINYFDSVDKSIKSVSTASLGHWSYDVSPTPVREGEILSITVKPSLVGAIIEDEVTVASREGEIQFIRVAGALIHQVPSSSEVTVAGREGEIQSIDLVSSVKRSSEIESVNIPASAMTMGVTTAPAQVSPSQSDEEFSMPVPTLTLTVTTTPEV